MSRRDVHEIQREDLTALGFEPVFESRWTFRRGDVVVQLRAGIGDSVDLSIQEGQAIRATISFGARAPAAALYAVLAALEWP